MDKTKEIRKPTFPLFTSTRPRVLIIDDDEDIREFTFDLLEMLDYEPIAASSGPEGLDYIRERKPDLVILDINMPDIDGWQTLVKIRSDKDMASLPVVICTGSMNAIEKFNNLNDQYALLLMKP